MLINIWKISQINLETWKGFYYLYTSKFNQKYLEMTISDKAIQSMKSNNRLMARMMLAFDRTQNTIENWMNDKDIRLTTPTSVAIIREETGLFDEDILEQEPTQEVVKG